MKKLLKNEVYGTVNSAQMHCSLLTWSTIAAKAKKEEEEGETQTCIQTLTIFVI